MIDNFHLRGLRSFALKFDHLAHLLYGIGLPAGRMSEPAGSRCSLFSWLLSIVFVLLPHFVRGEELQGKLVAELSVQANGVLTRTFLLSPEARGRRSLEIAPALQAKALELSGQSVRIAGSAQGGVFRVDTLVTLTQAAQSVQRELPTHYAARVAFISVDLDGAYSIARRENEFGARLLTRNGLYSWLSLPDIFDVSSGGAYILETSGDRTIARNNFGPYLVVSRPGETCLKSYRRWSDEAERLAQTQGFHAVDFDHVVFLFPAHFQLGCPVTGRGELGGMKSWIFVLSPNAVAHEIGHNLGLYHASRVGAQGEHAEYADPTTPMGAFNPYPVPFNPVEILQLGWHNLSGESVLELSSREDSLHVLTSFVSDTPSTSGVPFIRISRGEGLPSFVLSHLPDYYYGRRMLGPSPEQDLQGLQVYLDNGARKASLLVTALRDGKSIVDLESKTAISATVLSAVDWTVRVQRADSEVWSFAEAAGIPLKERCVVLDACTAERARTCSGAVVPESIAGTLSAIFPDVCRSPLKINPLSSSFDRDSDFDGVADYYDCAPEDPLVWREFKYRDSDNDGIAEADRAISGNAGTVCAGLEGPSGWASTPGTDNCPYVANPSQRDDDENGVGNACEAKIGSEFRQRAALVRLTQACAVLRDFYITGIKANQEASLLRAKRLLAALRNSLPIQIGKRRYGAARVRQLTEQIDGVRRADGPRRFLAAQALSRAARHVVAKKVEASLMLGEDG